MSITSRDTILLVLTLFLFLPVAATAQVKKTSNPQSSTSEKPKAAKTPSTLPLQSVTLVSTAEAVRKVAEEASAKGQTAKRPAETWNHARSKPGADGAVLEFHPTDSSVLADSAAGTVQAKSEKKSVLKNIHGSAYGATASGAGRADGEGGAVGADSRNGKFNIYVEGEHAHADTPAPH
jgi:hypothetical protein